MKIIHYALLLLTLPLLFSCSGRGGKESAELQELYARLDREIARSGKYEKEKETRIAGLKREYDLTSDSRRRTQIIDSLITEFAAYNADSTLHYISYNLSRPDVRNIPGEYTRLLIRRADLYAHAGLFSDALKVIESIPRDSLSADLLEPYYSACCATYQYLSEYTWDHEPSSEYEKKRTLYADSLNMTVNPESFNHLIFVMAEKARSGNEKEAIERLTDHLKEYKSGTREYSIIASVLSFIHKEAGNEEDYKKYLVLSAISDVQAAVKENMSFREVATVMFKDGDVEHANRYLKKSIEDANFYSALMRNAQSSKLLPVIDGAYSEMQRRLTSRLRWMVATTCVLIVILLISLIFVRKQYKAVRVSNERVRKANEELSALSEQLRSANEELARRNVELGEYNRTKEQYAGLFMEYCSSAISTLQQYRQSLRVAAQGGNRGALMKKLESADVSEELLRNFYDRFDEAILNIYPSFIEKFNSLLREDGKVTLKSGELLNTELRLFALIRLGIDDSAKIAQFLRCSLSTVYTYRSKMKKRALRPEEFENEVRKID